MIDLRREPPPLEDLDLVTRVSDVPSFAAHIAFTEAGLAFRNRRFAVCAELCRRSLSLGPNDLVRLVVEALQCAVDPASGAPPALADRLRPIPPQVAVQVVGLTAFGHGALPELVELARPLLSVLASREPDHRMEVASLREVRGWLGLPEDSSMERAG